MAGEADGRRHQPNHRLIPKVCRAVRQAKRGKGFRNQRLERRLFLNEAAVDELALDIGQLRP